MKNCLKTPLLRPSRRLALVVTIVAFALLLTCFPCGVMSKKGELEGPCILMALWDTIISTIGVGVDS
jgi:hypothetical protein